MKIPGSVVILVAVRLAMSPLSAQVDTNATATQRSSASAWQVKKRSEHRTEWFSVRYTTNAGTGRVRTTTNSYMELATSLNRVDENGQWQRSSPAFQITATGAEANLAGHRVRLSGNINSAGSVQVEKAGVTLQGHPLCIAYYDPVDGRSLLLAEMIDAVGWLTSSNEVVYSNCFDGLRASIRYHNSINGLEQNLILHERPAVTPAEIGFSDKTRLELFTEWIGDTPLPEKSTRVLRRESDATLRQQMVEPDFSDTTLTFGTLRMSRGKAFSIGGNSAVEDHRAKMKGASVGKRFEVIDGRKMLIEAVPHEQIKTMLEKLQKAPLNRALTNAAVNSLSKTSGVQVAIVRPLAPRRGEGARRAGEGLARPLPAKRLAQTKTNVRIQTAASSAYSKPGTVNMELASSPPAFILDWSVQITDSLTDLVLRGDVPICALEL